MELGGSDAFIVLSDANIDEAVEAAVNGRMWNSGQVCTSPKRIIVEESIADSFLEKVKTKFATIKAGNPMDPATTLAPLSSDKAVEDDIKQVQKAVAEGATLVLGDKRID